MKQLKMVILALAFLLLFPAGLPAPVFGSAPAEFMLEASEPAVSVNQEVTVAIRGRQLADVYAYEAKLEFDKERLEVVRQSSPYEEVMPDMSISGNELWAGNTYVGNKAGITGDTVLHRITFKARSAGTASVRLKLVVMVDSTGGGVTQWDGGALLQIAVTDGSGQPTPPPTPTPTATPASPETSDETPTAEPSPTPGAGSGPDIVVEAKVTRESGKAHAIGELAEEEWEQALHRAADQGVVIRLEAQETASSYGLKLPFRALDGSGRTAKIHIATPLGTIIADSGMLSPYRQSRAGEQVTLSIGNTDTNHFDSNHPAIEVGISVDGKPLEWENRAVPVTIRIPYTPASEESRRPEQIAVWYLDRQGEAHPVPNGRYDSAAGAVVFSTAHSGSYALAFATKTFDDLQQTEWSRHAVEVLASKGVIHGVSDRLYAPLAEISRADYTVLLTRALELRAAGGTPFADVQESDYYYEAVHTARALGIAQGSGDNRFVPLGAITREEMMVLTARALAAGGKLEPAGGDAGILADFQDSDSVADYARSSIAALIGKGIVEGDGQFLHPKAASNRGQAAALVYRLLKK